MSLTLAPPAPDTVGLTPETASALPDGIRRQVLRYLLRWETPGGSPELLRALLPQRDLGPRDRFDRCRSLLALGELEAARTLARDLVNEPDAGHWGHRAVGEVFLALERPERADERFKAGADPVGRARALLLLGNPAAARGLLRSLSADDPEAEAVRLAVATSLEEPVEGLLQHLSELQEDERREIQEGLDDSGVLFPGGVGGGAGEWNEETLRGALDRIFGYDHFRAGQLDVILPLLRGESVLGLMPTGAGKSLCFQLPAALLPGATVVISPLIALMKDQVDGLPPRLYRRATLINSSLDSGEAERRLDLIARGEVSLIYAAPERLRQYSFIRALQRRGVSLFVVDEAHCVSLWGHDFRPDYFFIRQALRDLGRPTVLALTATATPEMQDDIARQLEVPFRRVNLGTFRPNLQFSVLRATSDTEKWTALLAQIKAEPGPAIVYVDRRKLAEELAAKLRQEGIEADAYHAGLDRSVRDGVQTRFMLGEVRVITATVAFGMGVDKADVRLVVHYNLPRCLEAYYQEAGRAGRDGLPARCVLLYTSYDKSNLTRRSGQDRMQATEIMAIHRSLTSRWKTRAGTVSLEELERECAVDETRIRVGISLLERLGAVERGYDLPASLWFNRGYRSAGAPAGLGEGEDQRFQQFLAVSGLGERGTSLAPERAATAAGVPLENLEPLLLDWQEAGRLRFRVGGRGMGVRAAAGANQLERQLDPALRELGERDKRRLELLTTFLGSEECRQGFVSRYFGQELPEGCGACDNCLRPAASARVQDAPRPRARFSPDGPRSDEESALFELLKAWRREKAREEGVPAYHIFHDRVLYAIAQIGPKTLPALADVPGVGRVRLQSYGIEVLEIVRQHL